MRFLFILFLFGLAVAGSAFYAKVGLRASVEDELKVASERILKSEGYDAVEVAFDHLEGSVTGTVDNPADKAEVIALLRGKVTGAHWAEGIESGLTIRPTLPPRIRIVREEAGGAVKLEGTLAESDESGREMLGSRLHAVPGVSEVDNSIALDPMVLPFHQIAELASLASGLMAHGGPVEVTLAEGVLRPGGEVPNDGVKESLLGIAAQVKAEKLEEAIRVKPITIFTREAELKVTRNRFGITVSGLMPDDASRTAVLGALPAGNPGAALNDRIEVSAQCGPPPWMDGMRSILPVLLEQTQGEMTVEFGGDRLRLSGNVASPEAKDSLLARLAPLGGGEAGLKLETNLLVSSESPQGQKVRLTAVLKEDLLVLGGEVPSTDWVIELESRIKDALPELSIKNELKAVEGGPGEAWTRGFADFFVEALPRLGSADLRLEEGEFHLVGRTVALPDRQIVQNLAVNMLPPTYKVHNQLLHADQPFPKPALLPEQRTRLAESLKSFPIYFEKNSDELRSEEKAKVASIFAAIKESGATVALSVTGFADNIGNAAQNEALSLRRAESVRAELQRLGVAEADLAVSSKGEDVSRVSRSELWKARRVEVSLQPADAPPKPEA